MTSAQIAIILVGGLIAANAPFDNNFVRGVVKLVIGVGIVLATLKFS